MGQSPSISLPSSLPSLALHVLRTAENSPSYDALEPFFDYLVGLDSSSVESQQSLDTEALSKILADNEGGKVVLKVYNAKSQRIRGESHQPETDADAVDVALSPSRDWAEGLKAPSLGLSLRVCNPAHALESVYHVLDVLEGSPAEMAGEYMEPDIGAHLQVSCRGVTLSLHGLAALFTRRTTFTSSWRLMLTNHYGCSYTTRI
jgi:hypothetical protein